MQRTKRDRIKLLITLVLFSLVVASAWVTSPAAAGGALGPAAPREVGATKPGATIASGEPDAGQGTLPPPPTVKLKALRQIPGREGAYLGPFEWVRWTSRIWATLNPRAAK